MDQPALPEHRVEFDAEVSFTNGFRFHAAPPRVAGFGTWPVRAYAVIG